MECGKAVKPRLVVKPIGQTMRMKAVCSECDRQVVETAYYTLSGYNRQSVKWKENITACPYCKASYKANPEKRKIPWVKNYKDFVAEAKNGTFIVFRWDKGWRWSFRYKGEEYPRAENTGRASSREVAVAICEKHKEWQ
jgi:hypothetical protein